MINPHIEEAYQLLAGEAYRVDPVDGTKTKIEDFCTLAEELERIDRALGPPGSTVFAGMAEQIRAVFTEIIAARAS